MFYRIKYKCTLKYKITYSKRSRKSIYVIFDWKCILKFTCFLCRQRMKCSPNQCDIKEYDRTWVHQSKMCLIKVIMFQISEFFQPVNRAQLHSTTVNLISIKNCLKFFFIIIIKCNYIFSVQWKPCGCLKTLKIR